jgi:photolyase PhrII
MLAAAGSAKSSRMLRTCLARTMGNRKTKCYSAAMRLRPPGLYMATKRLKMDWQQLPEKLRERARLVRPEKNAETLQVGATLLDEGEGFVLYWMQTAVRGHENPALDVAKWLAAKLHRPLLVYHGLSERYPYASDRHHTFILEAVNDVRRELEAQGIAYAFHLERAGHRGDYLKQLAEKAAVVVFEDFPTLPGRTFLRALKTVIEVPIIAVDTACVVPMQLVGKAYTRAFEYRDRTAKLYRDRLQPTWESQPTDDQPNLPSFPLHQLPFEPIEFTKGQIPDLVSSCEIDHAVGPVLDTHGGSHEGYSRWNQFVDTKIAKYAKNRNNPLLDGVSRMSAYLHYGMVSPFRIAREAAAIDNEGAAKYLDELLIWRELAYAFCFHRADYARWSALPDWARKTLGERSGDARAQEYSWEQLARGQTDDRFWNAAQHSLLIHGELHNNVRMTWGKAFLNWRNDPKQALALAIDLNHRYALDGRDPASYGGILWCFGQFDRPFFPEQPIFGSVRPRPTVEHAQRLDVDRYQESMKRSRSSQLPRVAVIGGGLSGVFAARTLQDHGLPVTIFEKSRGVGGRMATRLDEESEFDHGAQYFTARDPRFKRYVDSWSGQGLVEPWSGPIVVYDQHGQYQATAPTTRYVGTPTMKAVVKHLAKDLDIKTQCQVDVVNAKSNQYELVSSAGQSFGEFDRVIVAVPAPQAAALLRQESNILPKLQTITMEPCWAVMAEFDSPLPVAWGGAFINVGPLRWIARNATKPGRDHSREWVVLHANATWSQELLEESSDTIAKELLKALSDVLGYNLPTTRQYRTHRWRYAIPFQTYEQRYLAKPDRTLIAGGDWAGGPRVEGAFLSGMAMAGQILGSLAAATKPKRQSMLF